jgi:hypothetical protein
MEVVVALLIWAGIGGFVASAIWKNKGGDPVVGFIMGALLGLLGIIMAAAMTPKAGGAFTGSSMERECPYCKKQIRRDASVCPYCQRESEAWNYHGGFWWVWRNGRWMYLNERSNKWEATPTQPTSESPKPNP